MYELINTSVPNGLIAGTHGFATVAMTKGMPDAIRTRVESFCAYPHRTSAHDQSYFRDNPVNWFHLQIPSGDHVVGRTAPADFDYTGRTNRLAHTLVFGAKEMPIVGGAYVLGAESRRFVAAWSGDPKYLAVDKLTAGRLGLADILKNTTPTNWTATFGEDGAKYARRFAALVAKNVSGGNKCVYFKTSTAWDGDGTRLLGLFADLINLLPEGIRPFVTFSTFAACVPNGVACHLRGVYDKDRAFEIASATQPWVDCEHGRIVHEELLPEEDNCMGGERDHGLISENYEGKVHSGIQRGYNTQHPQNAQQRIIDYLNGKTAQQEKSTFPWWAAAALLVAALVFVCAIVGPDNIVRCFKGSVTKEVGGSDNNRIEPDNSSIIEQNDEAKTNSQGAEDSKLSGKSQDNELPDPEKKRKEQEPRAKKLKAQAEDEAQAKAEAEVKMRIAKDKAKQEAAAAAAAEKRKATLDVALRDLPAPLVKPNNKNLEEYFDEELARAKVNKSDLTNADAVVVWYWDGTEIQKTKGFRAFEAGKKRGSVNMYSSNKGAVGGAKNTELELKNPNVGKSHWSIWQFVNTDWARSGDPSSKMVIWVWNDKMTGSIYAVFKPNGSIDFERSLFGGCDSDAAKMWQKAKHPLYLIVEFEPDAGSKYEWWKKHFYVADEKEAIKDVVRKKVLEKISGKLSKLENALETAGKDGPNCEAETEQVRKEIERARAEHERWRGMKKSAKDKKAFNGKTEGENIIDGIKKILDPYLNKFKKKFDKMKIDEQIREVERKFASCPHTGGHDKTKLEELIRDTKEEIRKREEDLGAVKYKVVCALTEIPRDDRGEDVFVIGINDKPDGNNNSDEDD